MSEGGGVTLKLTALKGRAAGAAPGMCKEGIWSNTPCYTGALPSCSGQLDEGLDMEMFALPLLYSLVKLLCRPLLSAHEPWQSPGKAGCLQSWQPCCHYRAQQGTGFYLFTKSQWREGFQGSLSFPEL